jgi:cell division protein FtsZ
VAREEPLKEAEVEARELEIPISEIPYKTPTKPVQQSETPSTREYPEMEKLMNDRVQKLRALSEKLKTHPPLETHLAEIESVPAYKRRNIELSDVTPSSESQVSLYTVSEKDKNVEIRKDNPFLHNKPD